MTRMHRTHALIPVPQMLATIASMDLSKSFYQLTPEHVLEAAELSGFQVTGRFTQLNSFENRVFDVWLEPEGRVIAKLYRPNRWPEAALMEEHHFLLDLKEVGIHAIEPLVLKNSKTLMNYQGLWVAFFAKYPGRMPQEFNSEERKQVGRLLAQIHNVGESKPAHHRPTLGVEDFGLPALSALQNCCAPEMWTRYQSAAEEIFDFLDSELSSVPFQRIHGDLHRGNLLLKDVAGLEVKPEFFVVDFDDFCNGPVAQDFWMLLSGRTQDCREELDDILSGYEELREFDPTQVALFEGLRGLRIIHYGGWIARRWDDPTFPQLFPQFKDYVYWAEETEALERIAWSL